MGSKSWCWPCVGLVTGFTHHSFHHKPRQAAVNSAQETDLTWVVNFGFSLQQHMQVSRASYSFRANMAIGDLSALMI